MHMRAREGRPPPHPCAHPDGPRTTLSWPGGYSAEQPSSSGTTAPPPEAETLASRSSKCRPRASETRATSDAAGGSFEGSLPAASASGTGATEDKLLMLPAAGVADTCAARLFAAAARWREIRAILATPMMRESRTQMTGVTKLTSKFAPRPQIDRPSHAVEGEDGARNLGHDTKTPHSLLSRTWCTRQPPRADCRG